jgi:type I restriction enzyme S subunit
MEWKEYQIQDVCRLINGRAYSNDEMLEHGKYKIVRVGNLSGGNSTWFYSDLELPADKYCHNGDLLFAWACTFGPHIWKEDNTIFHYHIWKIVEDKDVVDRRFFYYYLKFATGGFLGALNGSVMVHITKSSMEKMIIRIPKKLEDQRRIASILSSLDRKIELNNKINADLEEMAQAIFKNWFVDFEPFKDGKFVDSELGMIPEGWKVGTLKDLLYLRKDSIKAANKGNLPYLPIDTIPMHCLVATDFKSNDEAKSSLQTFEQNDIVVGAMRVYFHRVILAPCKGITRTTCFVLSVKNENALAYSLMQCNQDEAISFAEKTSKGSTMPYAVWDGGYGEYKVVIPPSEVMKSFNDLLSNFFSKMNKNAIENSRLSLLRDTLLPRLMSGELEVPE